MHLYHRHDSYLVVFVILQVWQIWEYARCAYVDPRAHRLSSCRFSYLSMIGIEMHNTEGLVTMIDCYACLEHYLIESILTSELVVMANPSSQ